MLNKSKELKLLSQLTNLHFIDYIL